MSVSPVLLKKRKGTPSKRQVHVTSFTAVGPVTVKAAFGTYVIGEGDSTTFNTMPGKKIITRKEGATITVLRPTKLSQSFVADVIGPNSSATLDFRGGGFVAHVNKGNMVMRF